MDCSPSGSSVHGILQARILEWVAMPSSSCDIKTPRRDAMKEGGELNSSQEPEDQHYLVLIPEIKINMNFLRVADALPW